MTRHVTPPAAADGYNRALQLPNTTHRKRNKGGAEESLSRGLRSAPHEIKEYLKAIARLACRQTSSDAERQGESNILAWTAHQGVAPPPLPPQPAFDSCSCTPIGCSPTPVATSSMAPSQQHPLQFIRYIKKLIFTLASSTATRQSTAPSIPTPPIL